MEIEGVITIKINGEVVAIVYSDIKSRSQKFFSCKEMNQDEVKALLNSLIKPDENIL